MNRPLKRILALAGSVVLGTLGAVALGSPAQAHHNTITAGAVCANGKIQINWTIQNSESDKTERLLTVEQSPSDPIKKDPGGQTIAAQTSIGAGAALKGIQLVDANTQKAKLKITAKWSVTNYEHTDEYEIGLQNLDCEAGYTSLVRGSAECDKDSGKWLITWRVSNQHPSKNAKIDIITASGPDAEKTATKTGDVWTTLANEGDINGISDGTSINAASTKTARQVVAGTVSAARLKVNLTWVKDNLTTKENSSIETVNFTGDCVKNAPQPNAAFASDCSGNVTVTLRNGLDATKDAKFIVTAAGGWTSEEITVPKGESAIVNVPAANSASVVVKESGELLKTYSWQDSTNCHPIEVKASHTCGGITVELENPAKGAAHTFKLVPTSGDSVTKLLQPGDTASFSFDAPSEGAFSVQVLIDDKIDRTVSWQRPSGCEPLDGDIEETCTGLILHLNNPQDGSPAAIVLTPTPGEKVSFTLNPGEKKDVEFLAGPNGLTVSGTLNGESLGDALVWEKPEDCPPPTLPKTGDNTAGYIASGTGLVALGAIVFFLARRRMVYLRRLAS